MATRVTPSAWSLRSRQEARQRSGAGDCGRSAQRYDHTPMKASVKCSNCGAEISNLNFSWGRKQWLWVVPVLVVSLLPLWRIYMPKGDFRQDLVIQVLERRPVDKTVEILGSVSNTGKSRWENINIDCLFFDPTGTFIDKASGRVEAVVRPGGKEYFKITAKDPSGRLVTEGVKMEAKVADAYCNPLN